MLQEQTDDQLLPICLTDDLVPYAFTPRPQAWDSFRNEINVAFGVGPDGIRIVGSARLGFSLKPGNNLRQFTETSDIDVAIVNPDLFDQLWIALLTAAYPRPPVTQRSGGWLSERKNELYTGWLDDMLRPAAMSGMISDMLTASMAKHARALVENRHFNGHPDLILQGKYPNNSVKAGSHGIEIKSTRKVGGAVDTHGARDQWMCVFVYRTDHATEPAEDRAPMKFTEVYLGEVTAADFRRNARGELGTRTATLAGPAIKKLRSNWIYLDRK